MILSIPVGVFEALRTGWLIKDVGLELNEHRQILLDDWTAVGPGGSPCHAWEGVGGRNALERRRGSTVGRRCDPSPKILRTSKKKNAPAWSTSFELPSSRRNRLRKLGDGGAPVLLLHFHRLGIL